MAKVFKSLCVLSLVLAASCVAHGKDTYDQWYSNRYNLKQNKPLPYVYGWPTLGVDAINGIQETPDGQVWLLGETEGKSWVFSWQSDILDFIRGLDPLDSKTKILAYPQKSHSAKSSSSFHFITANAASLATYNCQGRYCDRTGEVNLNTTAVTSMAFDEHNTLFVGTAQGLKQVTLDTLTVISSSQVTDAVTSVAYNKALKVLAVGTEMRLWLKLKHDWRYEYTLSYIDQANTLTWRMKDNTLWVGGDDAVNVVKFDEQLGYEIKRWGLLQGLPVANFTTSGVAEDGRVWLGGHYGVVSVDVEADFFEQEQNDRKWMGRGQFGSMTSPWRYFYEQRWLPNGTVNCLAVLEDGRMVASTEYGLGQIGWHSDYTLEQKAELFQSIVDARHNRFGLVAECSLANPGDLEHFTHEDSDNDGLWTNMYLASQCYRYKVTKSSDAKAKAWRSFEALERQYMVTPPERWGLMARSVVPKGVNPGSGTWYNSTTPGFTDWTWKADTSSDEVTGYYYALPLFMDHVCETPQEKARVLRMIQGTVDYIMENDWYLVDVTGKPTKWGFWNPKQLNDNPVHYSERELNSLGILSWLITVYRYTDNQKYLDAFKELGVTHGYLENSVNWRIQYPSDEDFSDDELGFMLMATVFYSFDYVPKEYRHYFEDARDRSWNIVRKYYPSLWTYMSIQMNQEITKDYTDHALMQLQEWPLEWIDWRVTNSNRLDVVQNTTGSRHGGTFSVDVLKQGERASDGKWNGNPYQIDNGDSGTSETEPTPWLLSYWIYRDLHNTSGDEPEHDDEEEEDEVDDNNDLKSLQEQITGFFLQEF